VLASHSVEGQIEWICCGGVRDSAKGTGCGFRQTREHMSLSGSLA